jgi:hypothetical protein
MQWKPVFIHLELISCGQSKEALKTSVNCQLVLCFQVSEALSEQIRQLVWEIMDANHFERSDKLLLDEFILNHAQNCTHDVFAYTLFILLVDQNIIKPAGRHLRCVLLVPKFPMDLDQLPELNGSRMININLKLSLQARISRYFQ